MRFTVGQTLSYYEIVGPLGSGAMGEVYRALDTRLDREVALKVIPDALAEDAERRLGVDENTAFGFTYSTRLALYGLIPRTAVVGEVFGATGEADAETQYKAGLRLELNENAVFALSYGDSFHGEDGALLEFGMMFFTPPFLRL